MRFRKQLAMGLACSMALLAGCGSSSETTTASTSTTTTQTDATTNTDSGDKPVLVVSTFAFNTEEERENIYKGFEELYDCIIITDEGNNAERLAKFQADPSAYDVVNFSDYYAEQAIELGLFAEIGDQLENKQYIYDVAQAPNGDAYGPGYVFNRVGIVYNSEEITEPITSWEDLWREDLVKQIAIPEITITAGPMMLNIGADYNKTVLSVDTIEDVFNSLEKLNANVVKYYTSSSAVVNMFNNGEVNVAVLQDFTYSTLYEANPNYLWVDPVEGNWGCTNVSNVSAESQNMDLAIKYVDYILSAEVQEKLASYNAPTRPDVILSDELSQFITYGEEQVSQITLPDWSLYLANATDWIDMWNERLS